ncbi:MAG: hypothetical protein ACI8T1_000676 [Verrucomicrobiales bacterium]|jgi:hypothetical protein
MGVLAAGAIVTWVASSDRKEIVPSEPELERISLGPMLPIDQSAGAYREAAALVEKIKRSPGFRSQMCSFPRRPFPDPVPIYGIGPRGGDRISRMNFLRLRENAIQCLVSIARGDP